MVAMVSASRRPSSTLFLLRRDGSGSPQRGQFSAFVETWAEHSGQFTRATVSSPNLRNEYPTNSQISATRPASHDRRAREFSSYRVGRWTEQLEFGSPNLSSTCAKNQSAILTPMGVARFFRRLCNNSARALRVLIKSGYGIRPQQHGVADG